MDCYFVVCMQNEEDTLAYHKQPDHRHGMNYKTIVTSTGSERYRAEGLFHMPGRWEYIFEVRATGATERVTTSVVLQ